MNVVTSCHSVHCVLRVTQLYCDLVSPPSLFSFTQLRVLFIFGRRFGSVVSRRLSAALLWSPRGLVCWLCVQIS